MRSTVLIALLCSACAAGPYGGGPRFGSSAEGPGTYSGDWLFASPMGEPFRGAGELRPEEQWFRHADTNSDGAIDLAEMRHDAARFFAFLDTKQDGEIDPEDIDRYEKLLFPELRVGDGTQGGAGTAGTRNGPFGERRGPGGGAADGLPRGRMAGGRTGGDSAGASHRQGAGRFSYLDLPEPVTAADGNFNRGISPSEFEAAADQRFAVLDKNRDHRLTRAELRSFRASMRR